jgi:hypothetical protein
MTEPSPSALAHYAACIDLNQKGRFYFQNRPTLTGLGPKRRKGAQPFETKRGQSEL